MRDATFCPGSLRPAVDRFVREVGRPRLDWTSEVGKPALQAAGGLRHLDTATEDASRWVAVVEAFVKRSSYLFHVLVCRLGFRGG